MPESVAPLERGLAVLRAVCVNPRDTVRPGELARVTGLARSTVDRVLSTLTHLDYLRTDGREFALAPRTMEFGAAYLSASALPAALEPLALRLADALDESVSLAVPDGDGARFVVQISRRRTMSPAFRVGDLLPAERCAAGTLFAPLWTAGQRVRWRARIVAGDLADPAYPALPPPVGDPSPEQIESAFDERVSQAVQEDWAIDDQLIEPGLIAIAAPIRATKDGPVTAALSVVSHTSRHSADSLRDHALALLQDCARQMEATLRNTAPPDRAARVRAERASVDEPKKELGPLYLRSLARGLAVLTALGNGPGGMTLSAAAEATGLPRATVRRALITLLEEGYVQHADASGRLFTLAPRVLELGYARLCSRGVEALVQPHLTWLTGQVHESASVAVLSGDDIAYVARVATRRIMQAAITVGTRFPAYATSMGRVLLAALPESERASRITALRLEPLTRYTVTDPLRLAAILARVAVDGYALVDQELEEGLRSMAVPIRDAHGRVVAAVNVSTHAGGDDARHIVDRMLPALTEAAARISADLAAMGGRSDPRAG